MRKIVYVLLPVVFLLVILFCAVFAGAQMLRFATDLPPAQSFTLAEKGRALVISTASDGDFPSAPGLGSKELKTELDGLLDHAQQNGFEAVYFEVTDGNSVFFRSKTLPASAAWVGEEKTFMGEKYHTFFKVERVANATLEELKGVGLGYRAPYLKKLALSLVNGYDVEGKSSLAELELKKELLKI